MKENDVIVITTDEGVTEEFIILFTYENEERGTKYVFFYDENNDEEVMCAKYFDDGTLEYVEDEEELAEMEEVFRAYESELEE